MELIIFCLIIIIAILVIILFLLKKELNRLDFMIKKIRESDSNQLLNTEFFYPSLNNLIIEINSLLKINRENKIEYDNKNKLLKKMIMNISHDLRTPLTSSLGYIDLILHNKLSKSEQLDDLKIIEERLKKLEELITSFFEFSRIITNNEVIEKTSFNLVALLEDIIAYYYEDYNRQKRQIIFNNKIKKYNINSNKEMLTRVFDNLINNALKHSEDDLEITLTNKDGITIIFSNKLDSFYLDIEHIFDEFYTIDISRSKGNTGLGLAIAKEFTSELGGTISARKNKGKLEIIINFK